MNELVRRRFEYMNALAKASIKGDEDLILEYINLIKDLDQSVSKHLNHYWSDIQLKYSEK